MVITSEMFEAYLKCPAKCWLQFLGEDGKGNIYSEWVRNKKGAYLTRGIKRLIDGVQNVEYIIAPSSPMNLKAASWKLAFDFPARSKELGSCLHAVERISSECRGKPVRFIPIRFIISSKLTKADKLMIAFDAITLAETTKREISHGKIIHGDGYSTQKVKTCALTGEVRKIAGKIACLMANNSPLTSLLTGIALNANINAGAVKKPWKKTTSACLPE
ncbi:MAG: hypothetical protein HZA01_07785 [Nitrospinae bacterium]|nr:hypothetical protein [Nitrospinota bacterium]